MSYALYSPTPSTPLSIVSGVVGDLTDNKSSTVLEVDGTSSVTFWFLLDLGSSKPVDKVELTSWYETNAADTGFSIAYSDSPLDSGNTGTNYGAQFSATQYPTTATTTKTEGRIRARYWGLLRSGNFSSNNVGAGDFKLFYRSLAGLMFQY